MKRLAIFFVLFLTTLMVKAQIDIDSVGYKAFRVSVHFRGQTITANSDALFYIQKGIMLASTDNQYKGVRFLETPRERDMGFSNDNLVAECVDNGGYACSFFIVFSPASETTSGVDVYTIAIGYSNILFIYECHKTSERPWKEDPLDIKTLVSQNNVYQTDPDYTDEEIEAFFDQFGNGKLIKNAIVQNFMFEASETVQSLNY
jgi:hypothetical protein